MNAITKIADALLQKQDIAFTFFAAAAPEEDFGVLAFSVSEGIFALTEIEVELSSFNSNIDLHALVDTPATITVHQKLGGLRHFSGVIAAATRGDTGHHRTAYRFTLLPAVHRLRLGSECRIFQQKTVPNIIKEVLKEYGIEDVAWDISEQHEAREYCVQYRESHLDFIQRIAAEEGIWFYFTSGKDGQQTLRFIDSNKTIPGLEGLSDLSYNGMASGATKEVYCSQFSFKEQVRSTAYTQRDYSFKNPPYNQQHAHQKQEDNGSGANYKLYEYPGRYKGAGAGKPFTNHRMEAARVDATTATGRTNAIHMSAGFRMGLTDHPRKEYNIKYLIRRVSHQGFQPTANQEEAGIGATTFTSNFFVQPARLPYRPPQQHKPLVDGPQIAHVTGPAGEEIYCDEHGRVKVWFPWDHRKDQAKDDKTSCWIRVSQNWGGATWGHMAIPRIGHEVIVDFLEGDPDQPIITGRTYHQNNKPPNTLPDFKTRMIMKSDSHKGSGFNELRFEDEAGQEEVWMHAQKYHNRVVGDNETIKVGANRHKRVDASQSESIGGSKDIEVSGLHRELIKGKKELTVGSSRHSSISGTDDLNVGSSKTELIGGNWTLKSQQNILLESLVHQHLKAPGTVYIESGDKTVIEAGSAISFKVGGNFIRIDKSGITIEGSIVNINSGVNSPAVGSVVPFKEPEPPQPYKGPHAERYGRSYEK